MSSLEASDLKLKMPLTSESEPVGSDSASLTAPTPERSWQTAPRTRGRHVALSIDDVRRAAAAKSEKKDQQIGSARRQIAFSEESPRKKHAPEKYEMLSEFFNCLDSSIRLLKVKGVKPLFSSICPAVEDLTERRFTYNHLAQLKHVMPEVIEIKKELVLDERTGCLNPDLHIGLNVNALGSVCMAESGGGGGGIALLKKAMNLRRVFRDRLVEITRSQPQDYEIPEKPLPRPFNWDKQELRSNGVKFSSSSSSPSEVSTACLQGDELPDKPNHKSIKSSSESIEDLNFNIIRTSSQSCPINTSCEVLKNQQPGMASHLSGSFRRHFSQKSKSSDSDNIYDDPSMESVQVSNVSISESNLNIVCSVKEDSIAASSHSQVPGTPTKKIDCLEGDGSSANNTVIQSAPEKLASTPKLLSTPARLMPSTPAPYPPKRCLMTPEDSSPHKLVRRPPRTRSFKFDTPMKGRSAEDDVFDLDDASLDKDILDILPGDLLQSLREKERKATEERTPAITQAKRRQKMIAKLPKVFNMIHFLFQSMNRSFITKQELVHKIIWNLSDMIDREDVEELLNLLLELVPDWISEKKLGGDSVVISINKSTIPEAIRSRLEEAN